MDFFKKLFGRPKNAVHNTSPQPVLTDEERFEKEVSGLLPRYLCMPQVQQDITAKHPETNEVIPFAQAFPEAFATWRTVKSRADRRGIIYAALDKFIGNRLKTWQVIERFTDDRYAVHALEVAQKNVFTEDLGTAEFWTAVGRTNLILTNYPEAEKRLKQALDINPKHRRARILLADVYHITGKHNEAHRLYDALMAEAMPQGKRRLTIIELLGFDGNIMHSSEYAAFWLKADPNATPEAWEWAGEEFCYCPHFRAQHAYYLIKSKEQLRGLTKLIILTKEMPWYKEAVLNAYNIISQLRLDDQLAEDKARLKSLMDQNNWSVSSMRSFNL